MFQLFLTKLNLSSLQLLNIVVALAIFFTAFLVSAPLLWLLRKYAPALGFFDRPGQRSSRRDVVPMGGGIAIFIGVVVSYALGTLLFYKLGDSLPAWFRAGALPLDFPRTLSIILGGGAVIFFTGMIDDLYNLRPWTKILLETAVVALLFIFDIRITLFIDSRPFSFVVTLGWLLLITNAFNLLDNMDGLSSGVAFISGTIFLVVAVQTEQWAIAFMLIGLLGGILGFLCFNFPPASIFMGDSGSLFIGYMMAVLTIHTTFYQVSFPLFPIILPVLVLAVPLFDTISVIFLRWRVCHPIFKADKRHISHRLVQLGMTSTQAVLTIYLITFVIGLSAVLLYQVDLLGAVLIAGQALCLLLLIHIVERAANNPRTPAETK